jgi:hypothetical protein
VDDSSFRQEDADVAGPDEMQEEEGTGALAVLEDY